MTKSTVTRLFVGSVIALVAGLVLGFAAVLVAFASDSLVGIEPTVVAWSMVGLAVLAVLAIVGGAIGGLVSWIGALLNTRPLVRSQ